MDGRGLQAEQGATIEEIAFSMGLPLKGWDAPIAAVLDNRLVSLGNVLYDGAEVRLVRPGDAEGREVYRRSLTVVLQSAVRTAHPGVKLMAGQSLGGGVFYDWEGAAGKPTAEDVRALEREMQRLVKANVPIELLRVSTRQAVRMFSEQGFDDRVLLLGSWWHESVRLVRLGDYLDIRHGPVAPTTGRLPHFSLLPLRGGVLLRFPEGRAGRAGRAPSGQPVIVETLFDVFRETKDWNRILGVSTVGQLNRVCLSGEVDGIVCVAEGLHERKVVHIVEELRRKGVVRLILVAGPSSSGKTTFAKRLGVQLRVMGLNPVAVSVDDYYVNREDTPCDRKGKPDFEALEAVDLSLFADHLASLVAGKPVRVPRYDFEVGQRKSEGKWTPVQLGQRDVLVIEGIHALNPRLSAGVEDDLKFRIYVSALTQLNLDDSNRISTTDVRLVRRLVRDRLFRGYGVAQTIMAWPAVKRGEAKNIFPYQDLADVMFNSTLLYELAVLKTYAQRFLLEVPHEDPAFLEAYRLLKFLDLFVGIPPDMVPRTSIIREFIGGSQFRY